MGSAIGFLKADIAYEVARSYYMDLRFFDPAIINNLFETMKREAEDVVKQGTKTKQLTENRIAFMRYRGQGHEIAVPINDQPLTSNSREVLMQTFESEYQRLFGRVIPDLTAEIMTWSLTLSTNKRLVKNISKVEKQNQPEALDKRKVFNIPLNKFQEIPIYVREHLAQETGCPAQI